MVVEMISKHKRVRWALAMEIVSIFINGLLFKHLFVRQCLHFSEADR